MAGRIGQEDVQLAQMGLPMGHQKLLEGPDVQRSGKLTTDVAHDLVISELLLRA